MKEDLKASGFPNAVCSVNHRTSAVKPDSQTALQPLRRNPFSDHVYTEIHFMLNTCRLSVGSLALRGDIRKPLRLPEEQHLHHMTGNFSRALSLMPPQGLLE